MKDALVRNKCVCVCKGHNIIIKNTGHKCKWEQIMGKIMAFKSNYF